MSDMDEIIRHAAEITALAEAHECDGEVEPPAHEPVYSFEGWRSYPEDAGWEDLTKPWHKGALECWVYPTTVKQDNSPLGIADCGPVAMWLGEQRVHAQDPHVSKECPYPVEGAEIHLVLNLLANGTLELYRNGEVVSQESNVRSKSRSRQPDDRVFIGGTPGAHGHGQPEGTEFVGVIGDFTIWDQPRTQEQIEASYLAGPPEGELPPIEEPAPPVEPPVEPPRPPGSGAPVWNPPELPVTDGGGRVGPSVRAGKHEVVRGRHFKNFQGGLWGESDFGGCIDQNIRNGEALDPGATLLIENCRFSDIVNRAVHANYGVTLRDSWFENVSSIPLKIGDGGSLVAVNNYFRNVCTSSRCIHPNYNDLTWHDTGAPKCTGTSYPWAHPEEFMSTFDIRQHYVEGAPHGAYLWFDWAWIIDAIEDAVLWGGSPIMAIQWEMGRGSHDRSHQVRNVEIAHSNREPHPSYPLAGSAPFGTVFDVCEMFMNCNTMGLEGHTVCVPDKVSAFGFQWGEDKPGSNRPATLPHVGSTATYDIDVQDSTVALWGSRSTLSRYWLPYGPNQSHLPATIRIHDCEVLVEASSQSEADARAYTFGASALNVRAMTRQQIEGTLHDRNQGHLV